MIKNNGHFFIHHHPQEELLNGCISEITIFLVNIINRLKMQMLFELLQISQFTPSVEIIHIIISVRILCVYFGDIFERFFYMNNKILLLNWMANFKNIRERYKKHYWQILETWQFSVLQSTYTICSLFTEKILNCKLEIKSCQAKSQLNWKVKEKISLDRNNEKSCAVMWMWREKSAIMSHWCSITFRLMIKKNLP